MILIIPMPMLWKLQVRLRRKIALAILFGSGVFIILCTVLRTIYSLSILSDQATAQAWAGREGFVSMIVVSAPGLWPLLRNTRWFADSSAREQRQLKPYKTDPPGRNSEQKRTFTSMLWPSSTSGSRGRRRPRDDLESEFIEEGYQLESTPPTRDAMHPRYGATGSEERIVCSDKEEDQPGTPITVTTEVSVLHIEVGQGTASKVAPANVRRPDR
jgi:hypothetical protein